MHLVCTHLKASDTLKHSLVFIKSQHVISLSCFVLTLVSGSLSPRATCSSQRCASVDATNCCLSQSRHPVSVARGNVNEQIATALLRLQHDMATVLHRLHALEAHTVSQVKDQRGVSHSVYWNRTLLMTVSMTVYYIFINRFLYFLITFFSQDHLRQGRTPPYL